MSHGGIVFNMRGGKGPQYHASYVRTPLEIRGAVTMSGPQPVQEDGGVPELVHQLFEAHPAVKRIALATDEGGVVYERMGTETSSHEHRPEDARPG